METITHINPAFVDDRGAIHNIFEGTIQHIALISSLKGTVRANHYHKNIHQYIYLISGAFESYCCDIRQPDKIQVLQVKPGDLVNTPPSIAHAQKFTQDSVFIALSTHKRLDGKYEEDTIAFSVTEGYINLNLKQNI